MKKELILVFLLGFLSSSFLFLILGSSELEIPRVTGLATLGEKEIPSDKISNEDIIILEDEIILKIPNATLLTYAATGSMEPFLGEGANGIRIVPEFESEIEVGDIISYRDFSGLIVHRVVEKGMDSKGVYFIAQGDNNVFSDGKIRFEDVEYITIGILY